MFKKKSLFEYILYSAIILFGILIDQLTKYLVFANMQIGESIPLIEGFLHITYTTNDGAAFGMMDDQRWVFILVSILTILGLLAYLILGNFSCKLNGISVAMIISGGIGNMIDRFGFGFYVNTNGTGEVIDFIDFCGIWDAIFNGADSFVCVGAVLLVIAFIIDLVKEIKEKDKEKEKGKQA